MAEVPIMYYNRAYYKKAGLYPNKPARTWADLQSELLKLRDVANIECPYASSNQVKIHLENLAPINKQLFTSNDNGLASSRSEEHTSELQSLMRISYAVFCLKKKKTKILTTKEQIL